MLTKCLLAMFCNRNLNMDFKYVFNNVIRQEVTSILKSSACIIVNTTTTDPIKPRSHCPGVRPGAYRQFVAGGPERTRTSLEGIRVRPYIPGFGEKVITVCHGYVTVCDGTFPV